MAERTVGDVVDELHDQCKRMVRLLDDAEWGLASWCKFVWDRGQGLSNLLAEIGIKPDEEA